MGEKTVIKVAHLPITDHLILGISKERLASGEDTCSNVSLETIPMMGWQQVAGELSSGNVDAACILAPTAMDLYRSGVKISLILFSHRTGSIFVKNKAANVGSIEDLKGKVVIIPYQLSVHNMLLHKLLSEKGLSPGTGKDAGVDVKLEVMAPAQMPQAIEFDDEGEIGGFIVAEPFGSQAIAGGFGEEFYLSKDIWPNHPCCVVVVSQEFAGKNPDAVADLTKSLVKSGKFVDENPDEAARIGATFLSQEQGVVKKVLTEPADRIITANLLPSLEDLSTMQDYMCDKMNVLSGKIDLEKFVDLQFATAAGAT